ncbi:hypothetical protein BOX15_Mlig030603g1 [Macrostomum lignano]|uniref:Uncharacterized protein n=1 Tax=Macrostomum lignano TaxID=282301 RepID=A0A267FWX5_9PLAT|nr:hypothetical protein BOX15_Mlig030603g2 [Macrostomum lignano]PAA78358.1 hypothetical protein BOX15_Mlig030603g1 [Macrostomum lignano]
MQSAKVFLVLALLVSIQLAPCLACKKVKTCYNGWKAGACLAAGGAAAVGSFFAAPWAVGLLGFKAGGIAAGSIAAWMQAFGGGITPFIVSLGQSIGAAGLSGTAAAGTGAAIAASCGIYNVGITEECHSGDSYEIVCI